MYCKYFGFSEKPFDVTPDPNFLYLSPSHAETLASIIYGIRERRGFIAVLGEVGTGKTTLLNAALDQLDKKIGVAFIFNSDVTFNQLLMMALVELGLAKPEEKLSKVGALHRLNDYAIRQLSQGGNVTIIVDEAQNLTPRAMENLRLLSNLETRKHKLVQIVLAGQPELERKLNKPQLRQLEQRICLRRWINPLDENETYAYIRHRLSLANKDGVEFFSPEALKLIWAYTGGVPRKINILCDNALLIGYATRADKIRSAAIQEAVTDLGWRPCMEIGEPRPDSAGEELKLVETDRSSAPAPFSLVS